jgi:hypothetical protein
MIINLKNVAYAEDKYGDYTYIVEDGYAKITGYQGDGGEIIIPENLNGYQVKEIGTGAFYQNNNVTKITIPETVLLLEKEAFVGCQMVTEIQVPSSVNSIGRDCFAETIKLAKISVAEGNRCFFDVEGVLFFSGKFIGTEKYEVMIVAYPADRPGETYVIPDFTTYVSGFSMMQNMTKLVVSTSVSTIEMGAIMGSKNRIDIVLKQEDKSAIRISSDAFSFLESGSQIVCKNEDMRVYADSKIYQKCATSVLASDIDTLVAADSLWLTSSDKISLDPKEGTYVTWSQIPVDTTDTVTWTSSDPKGLSIEPYTGKITANYRGSYSITGTDESGHEINAFITVNTVVDNGEIEILSWVKNSVLSTHEGDFIVGEKYGLEFISQFDGKDSQGFGIYPGTETTTKWFVSGKCKWEEYPGRLGELFIPLTSGKYSIRYERRDSDGVLLVKAERVIDVKEAKVNPELNEPKPTILGRPSSLVQNIEKSSANGIQLTWKKADNAKGYEIYRSIKKGSGYKIIKKVNASSYKDSKLASGTTYYYKVRAYSGTTKSVYTNVLTATTKPGKVALKVKAGSKVATLTWKKVKGSTGYEVFRSTKKGGNFKKIKSFTNGKVVKFVNKKLAKSKTYYFKIRSYKKVGNVKIYGTYSAMRGIKVK